MIKHFKRWNKWRKGSADSTFHKILVLLGIIKSPSYYMVNGFYDAIREDNYEEIGHWIDNHNGTISCSHCETWFHKDDRYYYMLYCPYCNVKMEEIEE